MITVECKYFRKNERWYGYTFHIDKYKQELQVYGANPDEAHDKLIKQLDYHLGKGNYALGIKFEDPPVVDDPNACHDTPTR